ncbi:MAG TPA: dihydrodipicolinate reductase C-terminal domain-containing protein [Pyrinomonadaceae bacterium]|nr:dihydrodipicolinate reductase C-terminal domain-containing protein [Pyrinomonadaceae bacterium]
MKIGLIGYGAMGRLIGDLALARGHEVTLKLDIADADRSAGELAEALRACDVAIDFSFSEAVPKNAAACARAQVPLVVGTTGWLTHLDDVQSIIEAEGGALVYGANFSIGVQIFYRIAARAAELFRRVESYDPFIEEAHHKRKRDAPSGTALQLQKIAESGLAREVPASSTRAGYIPGTHRLGFDSAADQIRITHEARSREGFAAGALLAAEWIVGRKGFYEFSEVFDEIIGNAKDV